MTFEMSSLCCSTNFVWYTSDILGYGATAVVYKGFSKVNGQGVAVKTFRLSTPAFRDIQIREIDVLKKMEHENIVKLLALETNQQTGEEVIITELCSGGSLLHSLNDPENRYGLKESEFLLVFEHLSAAVKYLRENKLVHRDLKPGNIMKFIHEDGTKVYKLADFGTARELEDHQCFKSICGTPEYLSPDIYEQIVKRKSDGIFPATVDLWSIGVTLYHLATGQLPFRPYGGRQNRELLYDITSKKESGVISVTQNKPNGPLNSSKKLPTSCQLSYGLKTLITPLIANLVESDDKKKINFETFFKEVDLVLARKAVHIFDVNNMRLIKLFILPEETFKDLQSFIAEQTSIRSDNQLLLYKSSSVKRQCIQSCNYLKTTEEDPLFLFDQGSRITLEPFTKLPNWKNFSPGASAEEDCVHVQRACIIAHEQKRQIEKYSLYSKLVPEANKNYTKYITKKLNKLFFVLKRLEDKISDLIKHAKVLQSAPESCNTFNPENDVCKSIDQLKKDLSSLYTHVILLYGNYNTTVKNLIFPSSDQVLHEAPGRVGILVKGIRKLWKKMLTYVDDPLPAANYEEFRRLDRIKAHDFMNNIRVILENDVIPPYQQLVGRFEKWYKEAHVINSKVETFTLEVEKLDHKFQDVQNELIAEVNRCIGHTKDIKLKDQQFMKTVNEYLEKSPSLEQLLSGNKRWTDKLEEFIANTSVDVLKNVNFCINTSKEES